MKCIKNIVLVSYRIFFWRKKKTYTVVRSWGGEISVGLEDIFKANYTQDWILREREYDSCCPATNLAGCYHVSQPYCILGIIGKSNTSKNKSWTWKFSRSRVVFVRSYLTNSIHPFGLQRISRTTQPLNSRGVFAIWLDFDEITSLYVNMLSHSTHPAHGRHICSSPHASMRIEAEQSISGWFQ